LNILTIVRSFGPVGGMERYVFETARELVARGHRVEILCRTVAEASVASTGVEVIRLQPAPATRSWQDRLVFREAVSRFFSDRGGRRGYDIIHSHENTIEQDVSTEHGPCTAHGLRSAPWKYLDPSARRNLALERQKFHSPHLRAIAFCARRVQHIALSAYPHLAGRITQVITPAYSYLAPVTRPPAGNRRVLGFIGRDWKRKGLPRALEVFRALRRQHPSWEMIVAGCPREALSEAILRDWPDGATLLGWTAPEDFFRRIDVLVHPAKDEPFGMVITEALTCGVPVVASDHCGCIDHLQSSALSALPLDAPTDAWAQACTNALRHPVPPLASRTWVDVAAEHEALYARLLR
jgi:UDP-glucose:(heptosyl)LPS alpha-1,3-glucosyltransferase